MTELVLKKTRKTKSKNEKLNEITVGHIFDEVPVFTAVGLIKFPDNTFSKATLRVEGDKILAIKLDPPNMKQIAVDALKIACMREVIDPFAV